MKRKIAYIILFLAVLAPFVNYGHKSFFARRTVVILSTNDMHSSIDRMPLLATAVRECRDTADVILVDAGDRVQGNAFVDHVEVRGLPMIRFMNRLGYNVATLGNHEFDAGQAALGKMMSQYYDFDLVCANMRSDTSAVATPEPYTKVWCNGIKFYFVGVTTTADGGRPTGKPERYAGLKFEDGIEAAKKYAPLKRKCDVLVLLSHMGDVCDMKLAADKTPYDIIIGGHTHKLLDTTICGTIVAQTRKHLENIGATVITFRGKRMTGIDYRNISLDDYAPDEDFAAEVAVLKSDKKLNTVIGSAAHEADFFGVSAFVTEAAREATDAEIGIYHRGGIRLSSLAAGDIKLHKVYEIDPFDATIETVNMTPAQIRRMIMTKYNNIDRLPTEARRIDLMASVPYTIVVADDGTACDVVFPTLDEGRTYRVAMGDYTFINYEDVEGTDAVDTKLLLSDAMRDYITRHSPIDFSGVRLQSETKK